MSPVRRTPGTTEQTHSVPSYAKVAKAARNNAEWCATVCSSHDIPSSFGTDAWAAHRRSPARYPDAVTLEPFRTTGQLLPRIDGGPGCSIKDSFATLEHLPPGFRVLFEAEWIGRDSATGDDGGAWTPVADAAELRAWDTARPDDNSPADVFRPALLDDPAVVILAQRVNHAIVGGAVLSYGANVVGISNLFASDGDIDAAWEHALRASATHFPNAPVVGYESGDDLAAALRNGFATLGPLRVWINEPDA
jgi:hypothetical protein